MQALDPRQVPIAMSDAGLEMRVAEVGEMVAGYFEVAKGTDFATALAALPDGRCQCPHYGYMVKGSLTMRSADGDTTYVAGQAFYWAPGHLPVATEDCAYWDFSPAADFKRTMEQLGGGD